MAKTVRKMYGIMVRGALEGPFNGEVGQLSSTALCVYDSNPCLWESLDTLRAHASNWVHHTRVDDLMAGRHPNYAVAVVAWLDPEEVDSER